MKYLLPILFAFCFFSCQRHSDNWEKICDIENYIESRPDSALAVLEAIGVETLSSDEERAKYALYMSMALDKNYIDKTDFEILQPAIDYYEDHGTATDKLRTFYYQGRIHQNIGDSESAMVAFVKGIEFKHYTQDYLTLARLLFAQGNIYSDLYNWEKYIECNLSAARYFDKAGKTNSQANCLVRIINGYTLQKKYLEAESTIAEFKNISSYINESRLGDFYSVYLVLSVEQNKSPKEITDIINELYTNVSEDLIDWPAVALAYSYLEDYTKAFQSLLKFKDYHNTDKKIRYYAILSQIQKEAGQPKQALMTYEKYVALTDSVEFSILEKDTQFIEERHKLEMATLQERERRKQTITIFAMIISILVVIALWISSRLRISKMEKLVVEKEAESYKLLYAQMEDERDNLNALLKQNEELDPKALNAVARRLELLNKFFTAYITDNSDIDRKASKEMEELLEDKEKFMDSNRLAYAGSHPKFIKYLEDKGLTEWEINYCCLYALGLKGKEVGAYIKMRSHYNNSSEVREKLGISEHDTNLGIYIRKLVKSLSE